MRDELSKLHEHEVVGPAGERPVQEERAADRPRAGERET